VTIPSGTTNDVMSSLAGIACHDILDGAREDVPIVWQAGSEGRSIVEGVFLIIIIISLLYHIRNTEGRRQVVCVCERERLFNSM